MRREAPSSAHPVWALLSPAGGQNEPKRWGEKEPTPIRSSLCRLEGAKCATVRMRALTVGRIHKFRQ
eukprot:5003782-Amphidinium_carterae.1